MKYTISVFYIILFGCLSCNSTIKNPLRKLSPEEILYRIEKKTFVYAYASFVNQEGMPLNEANKTALNNGDLMKDYYVDFEGDIKEVRVRPIQLSDQFLEIQIRELSKDVTKEFTQVAVNCRELEATLRLKPFINDDRYNTVQDSLDRQLVVSIMEQCGFPNKALVSNETRVFFLYRLLYSSSGIASKYYPMIREVVKNKELHPKFLAMYQDRLLMSHGYPQIYGTQIGRRGLYEVTDIENVNKRRDAVGLKPLEQSKIKGAQKE